MHTLQEAASLYCPLARMFGIQTAEPHCRGDKCMSWRWERITSDSPAWKAAIKARAEETQEKPPYRKAAAHVAEHAAALGLVPTKGFCGQGGRP